MSQPRVLALLTIAVLALASSVFAADVLYTSPVAFAAATTGAAAITFTAPCPTCYTYYSPTYTDAGTGTTFTIASGGIDVTGKDYYITGMYSSDFLVEASDAYGAPNQLTITLPAGRSAFAFDIGGLFNAAAFTVTLSDGATFVINVPASFATSFFGFSSTGGISSLSFPTPALESFAITDATIANLKSVPEPGTFALLAGGAIALAGGLRRKLYL